MIYYLYLIFAFDIYSKSQRWILQYSCNIHPHQHPLPNPEQLFVKLSEGEKFTKLDLSQAYQQILLDEDSREYVTINTHKGLYRPTRLPFGVASASAIFQSKIEQVLQDIPMVVCRVDDILVSGKNDQDHLKNLNEVLTRLKQAGLRLKMEKCKFMKPSVEYLGYRVDMHGLHAIEKKVEAIKNAPAPENQQQLKIGYSCICACACYVYIFCFDEL